VYPVISREEGRSRTLSYWAFLATADRHHPSTARHNRRFRFQQRDAAEGNAGSSNFVFTVDVVGQSAQTVTVNYTTANGHPRLPGQRLTPHQRDAPGLREHQRAACRYQSGRSSYRRTGRRSHAETFTVTCRLLSNARFRSPAEPGQSRTTTERGRPVASSKTASAPPFFATQPITYTLTISNAGPNTAKRGDGQRCAPRRRDFRLRHAESGFVQRHHYGDLQSRNAEQRGIRDGVVARHAE